MLADRIIIQSQLKLYQSGEALCLAPTKPIITGSMKIQPVKKNRTVFLLVDFAHMENENDGKTFTFFNNEIDNVSVHPFLLAAHSRIFRENMENYQVS